MEEGIDYLQHHIRVAGGQPEDFFDDIALRILARGSRGIPRLLNQTAHQALALAWHAEMTKVDTEAALETLARFGLEADDADDDLPRSTLPLEEMEHPIVPLPANVEAPPA
jgi:hypothetical protein